MRFLRSHQKYLLTASFLVVFLFICPKQSLGESGIQAVSAYYQSYLEKGYGHGLSLEDLKNLDSDGDGLSDYFELFVSQTNPLNPDTDGDGYDDYTEIYHGYSPRHAEPIKLSQLDSNNDKIPNSWKIKFGLNILESDNDGDGYDDYTEIMNGYNPASPDQTKIEKTIRVDLSKQILTYYFGSIQLEKFPISGGRAGYPTPKGNFKILAKEDSKTYGGIGWNFYYPNTKWNLHFTTNYWRYYIHGAYWHNNFGQPMSSGCVNVHYLDMERLYNFAEIGTKIKIF